MVYQFGERYNVKCTRLREMYCTVNMDRVSLSQIELLPILKVMDCSQQEKRDCTELYLLQCIILYPILCCTTLYFPKQHCGVLHRAAMHSTGSYNYTSLQCTGQQSYGTVQYLFIRLLWRTSLAIFDSELPNVQSSMLILRKSPGRCCNQSFNRDNTP